MHYFCNFKGVIGVDFWSVCLKFTILCLTLISRIDFSIFRFGQFDLSFKGVLPENFFWLKSQHSWPWSDRFAGWLWSALFVRAKIMPSMHISQLHVFQTCRNFLMKNVHNCIVSSWCLDVQHVIVVNRLYYSCDKNCTEDRPSFKSLFMHICCCWWC